MLEERLINIGSNYLGGTLSGKKRLFFYLGSDYLSSYIVFYADVIELPCNFGDWKPEDT